MNALTNFGTKVVFSMIAASLAATAAFAASGDTLTINLPEAATVNGSTLASGQYKVTETSMADGSSLLVFRTDKGQATAVVAMKSAEPSADQKSEVVLSHDGGSLHLDKMFIQGESAGFQFSESK
jgi:glucose/arabinose dehydrogenase